MRVGVAASLLLLAAFAARADDATGPKGCADYATGDKPDIEGCDRAVAAESDPVAKSVLLFRRAFMADAAQDYDTGLKDLDQALALAPDDAPTLLERGYVLDELGRWKDAAADLDALVKLRPFDPQAYGERALARFGLGDLDGALADRDAGVQLQPKKPASLVARAMALLWLDRFDEARADLDKLSGSEDGDETRLRLSMWMSGGKVGDATRAFFAAQTAKDKAAALVLRMAAWQDVGDAESAADDAVLAAALDPGADALSRLGYADLHAGRSQAAKAAFDRAIAIGANESSYAGRALARLDLGDFAGAIEDARRSAALKPNAVASVAQGDAVYATTNSYDAAKADWIEAYRLGDREDGLIERLKAAGVAIPPP